MFDMTNEHSIAAALLQEGWRVLRLQGGVIGNGFLFYGPTDSIGTMDIDCRIKIDGLPKQVSKLVLTYLRVATK